jgi:hypothetical protein
MERGRVSSENQLACVKVRIRWISISVKKRADSGVKGNSTSQLSHLLL